MLYPSLILAALTAYALHLTIVKRPPSILINWMDKWIEVGNACDHFNIIPPWQSQVAWTIARYQLRFF